jgi:hypothetical protein
MQRPIILFEAVRISLLVPRLSNPSFALPYHGRAWPVGGSNQHMALDESEEASPRSRLQAGSIEELPLGNRRVKR